MKSIVEDIDRYISGEMTEQERFSFEERLQKDEVLKKELQFQLTLAKAIQKSGYRSDTETMEAMKALNPKELKAITKTKKNDRSRVIYLSITIAATLLLLFSIRFFNDYRLANKIYNEYYTGKMDDAVYRGAHEDDDYPKALELWKQGEQKTSVSILEAIVAQGDINPYYQDASWNLGLFYLKTHKLKKARKVFENIVEEDGYYAADAKQILSRLPL
ncbi:hypothetical protein LJC05_02610 [Bacteroides sp. OttesenSCG-928-J23]|nr:hypothetical protein [Bacteroides sp. OttesenSCG-928-J23]MDL2304982.1 hypothetical protein [Bacteroides sp. OttesenSCG-928-D19]